MDTYDAWKNFENIEDKDTTAILGQCWRVFDAIDDYVTILDLDKRIISANHSLLEGFQVELSRIANCKCYEALWDRDENCAICPVEKVLHDLKTHTIEVENRRMGKTFVISASPIFDDNNDIVGMVHVTKDITDRKKSENALIQVRAQLEARVAERTRELTILNERLYAEIAERKKAETGLIRRSAELDLKSKTLEEANIALRVILRAREDDKNELEDKVLANMKKLVLPYLEQLSMSHLDESQRACVSALQANLEDLVSPFSQRLSSPLLNLTPREIQVANLIKEGRGNKEIARFFNIALRTVEFHRENIRKKIGLVNKKVNLRSQLLLF
ncbi:PAS domain S-box-containing protein [Desulfocicer vacuolatum DSM 3385]|uniref:PAS domain S-box-containing protein n=1 Tax=Desulfocicer vacuolatum DSM 3385 TaxID=1121400 RepID=A0A1W2C1J0_9BACT|nr:LuxR C-terminal-related transcriptional regulator [Desulfocicer vacuolatum]SMC78874.1 PAS domain S-box-containing protein [Desulfocicer vacuolatum DSM 3385]